MSISTKTTTTTTRWSNEFAMTRTSQDPEGVWKIAPHPYLKPEDPLENLRRLSHPRFSEQAKTGCIPQAIKDRVNAPYEIPWPRPISWVRNPPLKPYPTKEQRQADLIRSIASLSFYTGTAMAFWRLQSCVCSHSEWMSELFSTTEQCLPDTIAYLFHKENRIYPFVIVSLSCIWALSRYTIGRTFFSDREETTRLNLLHQEYDAMIRILNSFRKAMKENPSLIDIEIGRSMAKNLLLNMPHMQKHFATAAHIQEKDAAAILNRLSIAARKVLQELDTPKQAVKGAGS